MITTSFLFFFSFWITVNIADAVNLRGIVTSDAQNKEMMNNTNSSTAAFNKSLLEHVNNIPDQLSSPESDLFFPFDLSEDKSNELQFDTNVLGGGDDLTTSYYGPYFIQNLATGRVVDSNVGGKAYTLRRNGGNYQRWKFYYLRHSKTYVLQNVATSKVLDSNGSGHVYTLKYNGGSFQKWKLLRSGKYYVFKNLATGRVLDSNFSGKIYTLFWNNGSYQKWLLYK